MDYAIPTGLHAIAEHDLDIRADFEIDQDILNPKPVVDEKNVWFFWHSGYANMHPYTQRNVRAWHRRLAKKGWAIRVLDRSPSSPCNIAKFLDVTDPETFPQAFIDGRIGGDFAPQHTSDLVRWPLLLRYGGVYADAGLMQIGDLDRLWNATIGNLSSSYQVLSYDGGAIPGRTLMNYFLCSNKQNPLFARCHRLFLKLWAEDDGRDSTDGMHASPLLRGSPKQTCTPFTWEGKDYSAEEATNMLTDYIIQGQVISLVMGLIDHEDGWNGPEYVAEHVYAIEFMIGAQLINEMTAWDGKKAFELMSLRLPEKGAQETPEQTRAREVVEACLSKSFGFKMAHGLILKVYGDTLGSLWRKHEGSDDVPGTYAHWLRYGIAHWNQDRIPPPINIEVGEPFKRGPLLREH